MLNPKKKYNLEYYLDVVGKLVNMGIHVLGVKDSESNCSRIIYTLADPSQWLVF